ncbi:MAG: hypothetical protein ACMXYE_02735 [Candidatus Woesearchaeota archaeon]
MARRRNFNIGSKFLGYAIIIGLLLQYVFPAIKLGSFSWIATLIYLVVALILIFLK